MIKIAIVYFSKTGTTEQLANAVIQGLADEVEVLEHRIQSTDIVNGRFENSELFIKLRACHAIIFGTPTYMGGVSAQFKAFADASSSEWMEQKWADKIALGFTCGTGLNGDQNMTLQYLFTLASQQGMIWLGLDKHYQDGSGLNRLGCQMGVVAQVSEGELHLSDLATAEYLGQRLKRWLHRNNVGFKHSKN